MDLEWVRQGIRQCREAGTAVFVKQLGEVYAREQHLRHKKGGNLDEWPGDLRIREFPQVIAVEERSDVAQ